MKWTSGILLLAIVLVGPLHAQNMFGAVGGNNVFNSLCEGTCDERASEEKRQRIKSETLRSLQQTAPPPLADYRKLAFTISSERREKNLATMIRRAKAADRASGTDLERILKAEDVIGQMEQAIAAYDLKGNNLADAYAVYWVNAWQVANDDDSDLTKEQTLAIRDQAARALLATPGITASTDAAKQEMTEVFLVQAALLSSMFELARTDPSVASALPAAARQGASRMGLDLDAMILTENGFALR